jgi:methylated-DNA-[protein]-cysteine S-methyltransferase
MPTSAPQTAYVYTTIPSPVGVLKLVGSDRGLAAILFQNERPNRAPAPPANEDAHHPALVEAQRQLEEYFAGRRRAFDLKLDFVGTDFQKRVWDALQTIPFGETRTYGHIAKQLGNGNAMRAVGAANGRNPIPIVVPCHRVIGASGRLVGFGGGLDVKAKLLNLECGKTEFNFKRTEPAA